MAVKDIDVRYIGYLKYPNSAIVSRENFGSCNGENLTGHRGKIKVLSAKSRARLAFVARETTVRFCTMSTLTYGYIPKDGKTVKAHLNNFLTKLRKHYDGVQYLWFLEFQKRGAPHFHILHTIQSTQQTREKIARLWCDTIHTTKDGLLWRKAYYVHYLKGEKSGRKATEPIIKKDGALRYVTKYATKTQQKVVPKYYQNVGRFWGCSRKVKDSIPKPQVILGHNETIKYLRENSMDCGIYTPAIVFDRHK